MSALAHETLRAAFAAQSLFEDKTWQLSPAAWPLTPDQVTELEAIGTACLEFHTALETLYLRSAAGKNLLRNKPLLAPWVADYLDRGKPAGLVAHARDPKNRGLFPTVLRPDLLLTDDGFALTELDSVPGGIGLTAFLNKLYGGDTDSAVLGHGGAMVENFHASLAALRPTVRNPLIAILVSDEAATYRPEMFWLAEQLQRMGRRVYCLRPDEVFPLGSELCFDVEGTPEKIDIIYRFFELFDWANVKVGREILEAWAGGTVAIAPPMRAFQEEKLALALFHHHRLRDYWLLNDWRDLAGASQKERDLIIKISGFHETAWGARSVVLGSDCSREEWQQGIEQALQLAPTNLHLLQEYRKPKRVSHPLYAKDGAGQPAASRDGRLRLCPYYFVIGGQARLSGALATFCPPDKKIIHGMVDAALLPCRVFSLT
jgi:hypothetical protein